MRRKEELARCMERRPDTGWVVHVLIPLDGIKDRLGVVDKTQYLADSSEVRLIMLDDKSIKLVPWCACARVARNLSTESQANRKKKKKKNKKRKKNVSSANSKP